MHTSSHTLVTPAARIHPHIYVYVSPSLCRSSSPSPPSQHMVSSSASLCSLTHQEPAIKPLHALHRFLSFRIGSSPVVSFNASQCNTMQVPSNTASSTASLPLIYSILWFKTYIRSAAPPTHSIALHQTTTLCSCCFTSRASKACVDDLRRIACEQRQSHSHYRSRCYRRLTRLWMACY